MVTHTESGLVNREGGVSSNRTLSTKGCFVPAGGVELY
jgi:hypothetical protein